MCFHTSMSKKAPELARRYNRRPDLLEHSREPVTGRYHVSAFTYPYYPIITDDPQIQIYEWGLIPFWTKSERDAEQIRKMTLNARAESLFEKPSFREAVKRKRCIVPVTGFFDWRHENGRKIPYYIYVKKQPIFSLAGVYDVWNDKETKEFKHTFSVVTVAANPLMEYIHNTNKRMPFILSPEDEEKWIDPALSSQQVELLIKPFSYKNMDAYIIRNDFLRKNPEDPSILSPAGAASA